MRKKIILLLLTASLMQGCGIFKRTTPMKENSSSAAWTDFMENYRSSAFNEPYLIQKWSVDYASPKLSLSFTANVRMIKDSAILISISKFGFPIGKALITPEKAAYYENWNNTCYEGTLDELSKKIGLQIDFSQLQALLTGDAPVPLDPDKWDLELRDDAEAPYALYPRSDEPVKEMIFTPFFKIFSETFEHDGEQARVTYENYTRDTETPLPEKIRIETATTRTEIKVKKSTTGEKPDIRFRLPENCREINP